ncbi:MAG: hypothetical protein WCH99_08870 [Verrucomicrobiota bacterium]
MNKLILIIGLAIASITGNAQTVTNQVPNLLTNQPSFWDGISIAGQAALNIFKADTNLAGATGWVVVPFASYNLNDKTVSGGVAAVHAVTDYFYAGARIERMNNQWIAPSIELQLKTSFKVFGLTVVPFGVGGTAIINSQLAGYVGAGGEICLATFTIQGHPAFVGLVGDYETWTGTSDFAAHKQVNAGIALGYKF